jgi:hypothetical protein
MDADQRDIGKLQSRIVKNNQALGVVPSRFNDAVPR